MSVERRFGVLTQDWRILGRAFLMATVILGGYLLSLPRSVVLEDDGFFILAASFNGVAHPPGYPLFTAIAHGFAQIPLGRVAARVHAASAFFGASACFLLYLIGRRLSGSDLAAAVGAFCLGFSGVFWSQAIVAEVYTLSVALFLWLFWLSLLYADVAPPLGPRSVTAPVAPGSGAAWLLGLMAFLFGLSLTNHWPLMLLSAPGLLILLAGRWRDLMRALPWLVPVFLLGLTPYLWMYVNAGKADGISFLGNIDGWRELLGYVMREQYAAIDHQPTADWLDKLAYLELAMRSIPLQFGIPAALVGLLGLVSQRRYLGWSPVLAIMAVVLGNTVLLVLLLGFEDEPQYHGIFRVYPITAYALASLWIVIGFKRLEDLAQGLSGSVGRLLPLGAALILCTGVFAANVSFNLRSNDHWAQDYAATILDALPPRSVLFVSADTDAGPVGYLHLIEGRRPDVDLYHTNGGFFPNRLFHPLRINDADKFAAIRAFIQESGRPVFFTDPPPVRGGYESFWLFNRLRADLPEGTIHYGWFADPTLRNYLERVLRETTPLDGWSATLRERMIAEAIPVLAELVVSRRELSPAARDAENLLLALRYLPAKLKMASWLLAQNDPGLQSMTAKYLDEAESQIGEAQTKEDASAVYLLRGVYFAKHNQPEQARRAYLRSMEIWPNVENQAYPAYRALPQGVAD